MKPLVQISLMIGPDEPEPDRETLKLQPEVLYLDTLTEGASRAALLGISEGWLPKRRWRRVRFESEVFGNKEATGVEELRGTIGTFYNLMTPASARSSDEIGSWEKWKVGKKEARVREVERALDRPRKVSPLP
jgi:hypothetical protein